VVPSLPSHEPTEPTMCLERREHQQAPGRAIDDAG
jgi:hypothetical protein